MRWIMAIGILIVMASFLEPIAVASCNWTGTYEFAQYEETKDPITGQVIEHVDGPTFSLQLEQQGLNEVSVNYNGVISKEVPSSGYLLIHFKGNTPWPSKYSSTDRGQIMLYSPDPSNCNEITGLWTPTGSPKDYVGLKGKRKSLASQLGTATGNQQGIFGSIVLEETNLAGEPVRTDLLPGDRISVPSNSRATLLAKCDRLTEFIKVVYDGDLPRFIFGYPRDQMGITGNRYTPEQVDTMIDSVLDLIRALLICEKLYDNMGQSLAQNLAPVAKGFEDGSPSKDTALPGQLELGLEQGSVRFEVVDDQVSLAIKTPTMIVSSAGRNDFGVAYDPSTENSYAVAYSHPVSIKPSNSNLAPFNLEMGQIVGVGTDKIGPILSTSQIPTEAKPMSTGTSTYVSPDGKDIYGQTGGADYSGSTTGTSSGSPTTPPEQDSELKILDHTMANQVDESTYEVIARAYAFQPSEKSAFSWIKFGSVSEAHRLDWNWYAPDGSLYEPISQDIPQPGEKPWEWYNVYTYIDIAGDNAADLPGLWHVDILLDGQKILTEQFTILEGSRAGMDLLGPIENMGQDSSSSGDMQGGCYTDPSTGQTICVDYFGNPSGSETDRGNSQEQSGGCYQDPITGEVICVDMSGDLEDLSAPQRGCFTDPSTGEAICID